MAAKKNKSLISKVVKRAGVVARELRDVPTAAGTLAKTIQNVKPSQGGGTPTVQSQRAIGQAGSNLGKQLKEVGSAIVSGKSGTTSAQSKVKREVIAGKKRQEPKPAKKAAAAKPKITKAEKKIEKQLSPKGMKKAAKDQSKALDKKYPGLYKNN